MSLRSFDNPCKWTTQIQVFHSNSPPKKRSCEITQHFNVFLCLKFKSRLRRVTLNRVLSSHSKLLLPPNPKRSQLEALSVASLVSLNLFAVPVCSKLVHRDPKVMSHFTQNFRHSWTNRVRLPKTAKSGLKFSKSKQWLKMYLRFPLATAI